LKEYTDHTTHELQTPLAVIKSKTELLIQSENLGPVEMKLIQAINASTNQLSRLNSTLALITRIENNQFTGTQEIDMTQLMDKHLEMLQELVDLRRIELNKSYSTDSAFITMDEGLADILVANLLKNAIVHNVDGGSINLELTANKLVISNDGPPIPFQPEEMFRRFVRDQGSGKGFGLGLSLAKKICESYGFNLSYGYEDGRHIFTLETNY
jgi:signal transduction histidine kinase